MPRDLPPFPLNAVPDLIRDLLLAQKRPRIGVRGCGCARHNLRDLDALILAVNHKEYLGEGSDLLARVKRGGVVIDVKSSLDPADVPDHLAYWSL